MVGSRPRLKVRQPISFIFPCLQNESAKYCILISCLKEQQFWHLEQCGTLAEWLQHYGIIV